MELSPSFGELSLHLRLFCLGRFKGMPHRAELSQSHLPALILRLAECALVLFVLNKLPRQECDLGSQALDHRLMLLPCLVQDEASLRLLGGQRSRDR